MRGATGQDEESKRAKNPVKLQVFAPADKIEERDRDGKIGERD
jgi:hypothetical protein